MNCAHCGSPKHNLCEAGFKIEVEMVSFSADSDAAKPRYHEAQHLLGPVINLPSSVSCKEGASGCQNGDCAVVVVPCFSDAPLGAYGLSLLTAFAPELLKDGALNVENFHGHIGETKRVECVDKICCQSHNRHRVTALLVGLGEKAICTREALCGMVGSGIDLSIKGSFGRLVVPLVDMAPATSLTGQELAAVSRCRLAVATVEEHAERTLSKMTLMAAPEQMDALCWGIEIPGPFCRFCNHPRVNCFPQ